MKDLIGLWKTYHSGEVCTLLGQLIADVIKEGKRLTAVLADRVPIQSAAQLCQILKQYEKQKGTSALLDCLGHGLSLEGEPDGPAVRVFLRFPEGSQRDRSFFKDLIVSTLTRDSASFIDRYFCESSYPFVHSRLERTVKKRFGFYFEYKIIIEPTQGR